MDTERRPGPRMPTPTPVVDGVRDFASPGNKDTVIAIVRPAHRYGDAGGGERVRVDAHEMEIPGVRAVLMLPKEYKALVAEERRAREKALEPPRKPVDEVRSSIASQIAQATKDAIARRRGDARFVQYDKPAEE